MVEIERLRARLKNIKRGTSEYRMTVAEARLLLAECDTLVPKPLEVPIIEEPLPEIIYRVLDGGSL